MNKNLSEENKKYEREFIDLLIQRITDAGGSLQFQHLSGLIQQARFEIRNAFGTTKSELMKFLKAHPKIFQIDSDGIVTISHSSSSVDDTEDICSNREIKSKRILHSKIDKGIGYILRIHPNHGIIKATEPIETHVYFESQAFFNKKDCLLTDSPLLEGDEVFFNATHGCNDCDHNGIDYSATKVWPKHDECENSNKTCDPPVSNELIGQGIVERLQANGGYISNNGKREGNIFFHKTSVKDCDCDDLTLFLKNGDCVEFVATKQYRDSKTSKWQATSVRKSSQNVMSSTDTKSVKTKFENEPGKIYPTSTGAVIKFGKNFTEQADGNSCSYFLYGGEVTDIKYEFNEGDDILFDAVKTKFKWKALLVWVGEKPIYFDNKKSFSDNKSEVSDTESVLSSKASSLSHSSKPMIKRPESKSKRVKEKKISSGPSNSRTYGRHDEKFKNQPSRPQNSENFSTRKFRNGSSRNMSEKDNKSFVNRRGRNKNRRGNERKFTPKFEQNKSFNKNTYESEEDINKTANSFEDQFTYKDDYSNFRQDDSDEDVQGLSLGDKRGDTSCLSAPRYNFSDTSDNDTNNSYNDRKLDNDDKKMASIKKIDDVEGKIVKLHCKFAFIESSSLQKSIDFMLNDFYLNGKSVEEQQVIDLKEIIKVGDVIKFNSFEIIDDDGNIHQKVTMAWKGQKPEVYEMTPEEFVRERDLSVTLSRESETFSGQNFCPKMLLGGKDLERTPSESSAKGESEEEVSDDKYSRKFDSDSIEEE